MGSPTDSDDLVLHERTLPKGISIAAVEGAASPRDNAHDVSGTPARGPEIEFRPDGLALPSAVVLFDGTLHARVAVDAGARIRIEPIAATAGPE